MNLIWATRGRSWGFRFLLDAGIPDPLPTYERAFMGNEGETTVYRRVGRHVALRFPDPKNRHDEAGRVIPHDIVVLPPLADDIRSPEEGQHLVWPLLASAFDHLWNQPRPPTPPDVQRAFSGALDGTAPGATSDDLGSRR